MQQESPTNSPGAAQLATWLQKAPLFALVERAMLEKLATSARIVRAPAGTRLITQGELGNEAFLLIEGVVDIVVEFEALGAIRVSQAAPFDIIGETGAICHAPRTSSVVAREDVMLLEINQADLAALTSRHPEVTAAILRTVADRLHRAGRHLACLISAARALREGSASIEMVGRVLRSESDFAPYAEAIEMVAGQIARNEALRQEMEAAARIQQSILPRTMAWRSAPFAEIAATMRPARHVGGDFYDYFLIDDDRLALVVGDVSGKGVAAALFMALARNAFRTMALTETSPARVLGGVNRMLCEGNSDLLFLTAVYATLDRRTGALTYSIGGHDAPLLLQGAHGVITLAETGDMALGIEESLEFAERSVLLGSDDMLVIYTDGVTEAQDRTEALFGRQRLRDLLTRAGACSASAMIEAVNAAVDGFTATVAQADDITCLALRLTDAPREPAAPAPRPATLELKLAARVDELRRLAAALERFRTDLDLPAEPLQGFGVALDELVGNVIVHGYAGRDGTVHVRVDYAAGWLTAVLTDNSPPYNPLGAPTANPELPLEDRRVGGLGVYLALKLTDEIHYRQQHGRNVLTVRKRILQDVDTWQPSRG